MHLTSVLIGGAGQYTLNIHHNMLSDGYESFVCASGKQLIYPNGETVDIPTHQVSWLTKLKRWLMRRIIKISGGVDDKYAPYNLFERLDLCDPMDLIHALPQSPTHIVIHWVSGFANAKYVNALQKQTDAKIIYWMIDEACLSGGCHYPWDCGQYQTGCHDCPMTKSWFIKRAIRNNFLYKQRYIVSDAEVVVPTDMDRMRLEKSLLWNHHKWHKLIEIVNEEIFYPVKDKSALRKEFNLPLDKRIILFGSTFLDEQRKGMRVLLEALQKVDRSDAYCVVVGSRDELSVPLPYIRLGRVDIHTLAKLYRLSDVFICPSLEDSGPQMVNQSIMSGIPVVSFEIGVSLDIVRTGETGYRAQFNNPDDLAKGVNYILDLNKSDYQKMCINCRELALNLYSKSVQSKFIKNLLDSNV